MFFFKFAKKATEGEKKNYPCNDVTLAQADFPDRTLVKGQGVSRVCLLGNSELIRLVPLVSRKCTGLKNSLYAINSITIYVFWDYTLAKM